jgi:hypothetical protein
MDEQQKILDTLMEFMALNSALAAIAAFLAASLAVLAGEFVNTRQYLFEMALVCALVACAFGFGMRALRQRAPGEPRHVSLTGLRSFFRTLLLRGKAVDRL